MDYTDRMNEVIRTSLNEGKRNVLFFVPFNDVDWKAEPAVEHCLNKLGYENVVVFTASFYNDVQRVVYEENSNGILEPHPCVEWYLPSDIIDKLRQPNTVLIMEYAERVSSPDAQRHLVKLVKDHTVTVPIDRNTSSEVKLDDLKMVIALSEKDDLVFPMPPELLEAFDVVERLRRN